jgi:hypothetical protein
VQPLLGEQAAFEDEFGDAAAVGSEVVEALTVVP